jgi:hypothetical protein
LSNHYWLGETIAVTQRDGRGVFIWNGREFDSPKSAQEAIGAELEANMAALKAQGLTAYGFTGYMTGSSTQMRVVVAAKSKAAIARAIGARTPPVCTPTGNPADLRAAASKPGAFFAKPLAGYGQALSEVDPTKIRA